MNDDAFSAPVDLRVDPTIGQQRSFCVQQRSFPANADRTSVEEFTWSHILVASTPRHHCDRTNAWQHPVPEPTPQIPELKWAASETQI
jgi:hypothetical protein